MKLDVRVLLVVLIFVFAYGCGDDDSVTGPKTIGTVSGQVTYLDGAKVSQLSIQFLNVITKRSYTSVTDASGNFSVSNLAEGKYELTTQGTSSLVYKYVDTVEVNENRTQFNFIFKYRYIDDFKVIEVNDDLSFVKFNTFDTHVGSALDSINYVAGYFQNDFTDANTLSADIYQIPNGIVWETLAQTADADYVKNNFTKLTTINEITQQPHHILVFQGSDLNVLFSNPANGFAFVNADTTKVLKIPCIDRANNDFGLEIFYK